MIESESVLFSPSFDYISIALKNQIFKKGEGLYPVNRYISDTLSLCACPKQGPESHVVYFCVQRFEEREVIVSFVEDHMCIFVSRGLRRER